MHYVSFKNLNKLLNINITLMHSIDNGILFSPNTDEVIMQQPNEKERLKAQQKKEKERTRAINKNNALQQQYIEWSQKYKNSQELIQVAIEKEKWELALLCLSKTKEPYQLAAPFNDTSPKCNAITALLDSTLFLQRTENTRMLESQDIEEVVNEEEDSEEEIDDSPENLIDHQDTLANAWALMSALIDHAKSIDPNMECLRFNRLVLCELIRVKQYKIAEQILHNANSLIDVYSIESMDLNDPEIDTLVKTMLIISDFDKKAAKDQDDVKGNLSKEGRFPDSYQPKKREEKSEIDYPELVESLKKIKKQIIVIFDRFSEPRPNKIHFFNAFSPDSKFDICYAMFKNEGFGNVPCKFLNHFINRVVTAHHEQTLKIATQVIPILVVREFLLNLGLCKTAGVPDPYKLVFKNMILSVITESLRNLDEENETDLKPDFLLQVRDALIKHSQTADDLKKSDVVKIAASVINDVINTRDELTGPLMGK